MHHVNESNAWDMDGVGEGRGSQGYLYLKNILNYISYYLFLTIKLFEIYCRKRCCDFAKSAAKVTICGAAH